VFRNEGHCHIETDVVAGVCIFGTYIPQTNDQKFHGCKNNRCGLGFFRGITRIVFKAAQSF
jgi:hypothetical protein